jgi:hypothetical protein
LITPLSCPRPIRYCPTCGVAKKFACSERFRVNAQKKLLDVWLHYRCSDCGGAWKYPVLERQSIATLSAEAYESYVRHDTHTVWQHAFDLSRMRPHVMEIDANVSIMVVRSSIGNASEEGLCIHFEVPFPCEIRLDRLLASELRWSRTKVQYWYDCGRLRLLSERSGALNKPVRTGQRLILFGIAQASCQV